MKSTTTTAKRKRINSPEIPEGCPTTREAVDSYKSTLKAPEVFSKRAIKTELRSYQREVAQAVFDSVIQQLGFSFVVIFPRQSGKNELQAHLEAYMMTLFARYSVEMIKVSPTLDPQAKICMRRFEKVIRQSFMTPGMWKKSGNGFTLREAHINFLSAAPASNIVGATASGLLEVDEAQDVTILKFDTDVSPMSASTNATRVFWGTAWTSKTLLGRELRAALEDEKKDGIRRVFKLTAEDIYKEVPAYRKHVEKMVAREGRNHPSIRTQYFSEEIDGAGGMFPAERIARMRSNPLAAGNHASVGASEGVGVNPTIGAGASRTIGTGASWVGASPTLTSGIYALLLDVAGEDEGVRGIDGSMSMANPARDATALTLVEIVLEDRSIGGDDTESVGFHARSSTPEGVYGAGASPAPTERSLPIYMPIRRWQWIGANHNELQRQIRDIALEWKARAVVVDATGVGAGLASFLERALPGRVTQFVFNAVSKSKLGWGFLSIVDSYRWQEPVFDDLPGDDQLRYQKEFFTQLAACQFEVSGDAKHTMKWSVPDGSRDTASGELIHDDWVFSAALCAELEKMDWGLPSAPMLIQGVDPIEEMDGKY